MKKILYIIMVLLIFTSFNLATVDCCYGGSDEACIIKICVNADDDFSQRAEHVHAHYVACEKKAGSLKFIRSFKRIDLCDVNYFEILDFNLSGVLNESIKRDYSGDDPAGDSVNIDKRCYFGSTK